MSKDINKNFTTYEIASKLKELGFDEPCMKIFIDQKLDDNFINNVYNHSYKYSFEYYDYVTAPLWEQVIDFFREEKNIIVNYSGFFLSEYLNPYWQVCIENNGNTSEKCYSGTTNTIEEAREFAILKAIELCNEKI